VNGNNLCNYKIRIKKNYNSYQYQVSKKSGDVVNDLELEGAIVICYHHQNIIAQQKTESFQIRDPLVSFSACDYSLHTY
jgi:hypothetical protein